VLAVFLTWVVIGIVLGWAMGRRGYDAFSWSVIGVLLGPAGVVFARWARQDGLELARRSAPPLSFHKGPVDVLVGLEGSPVAEAALSSAVKLLGSRIGRLTVVTVLGYDVAESPVLRREEERAAEASFSRIRPLLGEIQVDRQTLVGWPADVLRGLAVDGDYDVIVVGCAGTGMSKRLLGSTAEQLTAGSPVPVVVGPRTSIDFGTVDHATSAAGAAGH
jgi:nucleotide-binding universal stress UspA family protein